MSRLFLDLLSDHNERDDNNVADPKSRGWDGSSTTGEVLGIWREAAKQAGLRDRTAVVERDKIIQSVQPSKTANASHGGFDNDVETFTTTLKRITGGALQTPVDDLRGF